MRAPVRIRGGVVVQGGIGLRGKGQAPTSQQASPYPLRALVVRTRITDNLLERRSAYQVTCDVILARAGVPLRGVPVMQRRHGVSDVADLWMPKPATRVVSNPSEPLNLNRMVSKRGTFIAPLTRLDDTDGEFVLVSFMDGLVDKPVIIGACPHAQTRRVPITGSGWSEGAAGADRGIPQSAESYTRYAGTETRINTSGDLLIDTVGATTDEVSEAPDPAGGQVRIRVKSAERFTVEMNGLDVLEVFRTGSQIRIDLGEGATERLVLGDAFMTFLNNFLVAEYNAHTHSTGTGPSGPPLPATQMTGALLSDVSKTRKI